MRLISISEGWEHDVIKDNASYINTPDPRPTRRIGVNYSFPQTISDD